MLLYYNNIKSSIFSFLFHINHLNWVYIAIIEVLATHTPNEGIVRRSCSTVDTPLRCDNCVEIVHPDVASLVGSSHKVRDCTSFWKFEVDLDDFYYDDGSSEPVVENPIYEPTRKIANQSNKEVKTSKPQSKSNNNYMSEEEEIIAWNKWRSDILNKVMVSSNIEYAPLGTIFAYSFKVDKFKNVSNIQVQSLQPDQNSLAQKNIKPAIQKLNRNSILEFPKGTERASTVAEGVFVIGTQSRFSTPNDFADYERVMR